MYSIVVLIKRHRYAFLLSFLGKRSISYFSYRLWSTKPPNIIFRRKKHDTHDDSIDENFGFGEWVAKVVSNGVGGCCLVYSVKKIGLVF